VDEEGEERVRVGVGVGVRHRARSLVFDLLSSMILNKLCLVCSYASVIILFCFVNLPLL
jgi:hypothetical protein